MEVKPQKGHEPRVAESALLTSTGGDCHELLVVYFTMRGVSWPRRALPNHFFTGAMPAVLASSRSAEL
jgi:hypothetical protein